MLLVVDANVILSILIAKGSKHKLFFSNKVSLSSPDRLLFEIGKHWKELSEKSGLSEKDLEMEFAAIRMQMKTFSMDELSGWMKEASATSPDPDDAEYFALALKLGCPLWSEEKKLKKQSKVKVYNTPELLQELGLKK